MVFAHTVPALAKVTLPPILLPASGERDSPVPTAADKGAVYAPGESVLASALLLLVVVLIVLRC